MRSERPTFDHDGSEPHQFFPRFLQLAISLLIVLLQLRSGGVLLHYRMDESFGNLEKGNE